MNEHTISPLQLILILDDMGNQVRAAKEADTIQESRAILGKLEEQMSSLKEDIIPTGEEVLATRGKVKR